MLRIFSWKNNSKIQFKNNKFPIKEANRGEGWTSVGYSGCEISGEGGTLVRQNSGCEISGEGGTLAGQNSGREISGENGTLAKQNSGCEISGEGRTSANRILDVRYPEKVERWPDRIPNVRYLKKVERRRIEFWMWDIRRRWNVGGQNSEYEISGEDGMSADKIPDVRYPEKVEWKMLISKHK